MHLGFVLGGISVGAELSTFRLSKFKLAPLEEEDTTVITLAVASRPGTGGSWEEYKPLSNVGVELRLLGRLAVDISQ